MVTQKRLKELLNYNPKTGLFTWLVSNGNNVIKGRIAGTFLAIGYINVRVEGYVYKAHRLAFLYMNGWHPKYDVDHIDHVKHNNRWGNLRSVSHSENQKNKRMLKNNSSGFTGVYNDKRHNKWYAQIHVNGENKHLGYFKNKSDAVQARVEANIKYNFHDNHGVKVK